MTRSGEKGVALVFTLFLMAALSAMAVSLMFLAQTETSASRNYKTMSQARYGGEAGVHRALNYLSSIAYTNAVTTTSGFVTTVSPVTTPDGNPVVLAPVASDSNHPDSAIKAAYAALFSSSAATLSVGNGGTVTYTATATLLSMRLVNVYGGSPSVVQNWRITATGTVPGSLPATVEVAAILERDSAPAETYAVFATGSGCGAITMSGSQDVTTDSYDSTNMTLSGGVPVTQPSGGSVGTNGNLTIGGHVQVNGNLDSPRTGVGNCSNGNITALSQTNQADVTGDKILLPQAKTYPTPDAPDPMPPTTALPITASTGCAALGILPPDQCDDAGGGNLSITINNSLTEITWGDVAMSGGSSLTITAGALYPANVPISINANSWSLAGSSTIVLGPNTSVVLNVAGTGFDSDDTVIDFEGGSITNPSFDPSKFQILYAGTGNIKLTGGTDVAATVYAPNASVSLAGGADMYGSVLANTVTISGGGSVHYDTSLASKFFTLGQHVMSSFSWQKY